MVELPKPRVISALAARKNFQEVPIRFPKTLNAPSKQAAPVFHAGRTEKPVAKQTTITIETKSLLVLRSRTFRRSWCPVCCSETEMIAVEDTGLVSNLGPAAFEQWLNSCGLHRIKTPDGSSLICLHPLLARVQNTNSLTSGNPQLPSSNKEKL